VPSFTFSSRWISKLAEDLPAKYKLKRQSFRSFTRKPQSPLKSDIEADLTDKQKLKTLLKTAAIAVGLVSTPDSVNAVTLTNQTTFSVFLECANDGIALVVGQQPTDAAGWQYAIDSSSDGVAGEDVGGNTYEIYSMGIKETSDHIYVAINSNTPYEGNPNRTAQNGTVSFGDLFVNLDALSTDFQEANNANSLYAVRFVENNDSGVTQLGVYGNVKAKSVTEINAGFSSITRYNQHVVDNGGTPSFGDLAADTSYFDLNKSFNEIASGDFLGAITLLSDSDLSKADFNWGLAPGQHTIAFKFDRSLVPSLDSESVPEPGALKGFALLGAIVIARRCLKACSSIYTRRQSGSNLPN
jgi:hypothetical protein